MKVTVYGKPNCPQCKATEKYLTSEGVEYLKVNLMEDIKVLEQLKKEGFLSAPVVKVETATGEVTMWSGFRPEKIKAL